jgi:hypothetical protein
MRHRPGACLSCVATSPSAENDSCDICSLTHLISLHDHDLLFESSKRQVGAKIRTVLQT